MKLPEAGGGATRNRRELSWPGRKDEVPTEARALLVGVIRRAELDQVVATETTRLPWSLGDQAGNQWAELDDDHVTVTGGPRDGLRYRQIEIERTGDGGDEVAMLAAADALRRAGAKPDDQPKLARALGLGGDQHRRPSVRPAPTSTAAEVVRSAVGEGPRSPARPRLPAPSSL